MYVPIAYNSFTISFDTQAMLEAPLEKKTGTIFGPPGTKKLIYFIDDLNMPAPDKYGTQSAIATVHKAVKVSGGRGFYRGFGLERLLRDVLAAPFHPLPEKKQQLFTGRLAMGLDPISGAQPDLPVHAAAE